MQLPLTGNYVRARLEENLARFASIMRREGFPVGTTELIDALQSLELIDLSSRSAVKTALQATLVKNQGSLDLFSRLFDQFFVPASEHRSRAEVLHKRQEEHDLGLTRASAELKFKGESLNLNEQEFYQYGTLSPEERESLRDFVAKTESGKNVQPRFRPLLETVVKGHLRYCRSKERSKERPSNAGPGGDGAGRGGFADQALREADIETISAAELPAAEILLQRLSKKLAVKLLRRKRNGPRSGPLDMRRSMRDNMRFGGVIFKLKHRPKRRHRQQILLLCDFSSSMKRYSTFVIHFIYGLREAVRGLECFSFSDRLQNLTPDIRERASLKTLLDRVVRRSETWGGGTDIAASIKELRHEHGEKINYRTTVVVVSDTKTVAVDAAREELKLLGEDTRRIIWLNPLPRENWPDYRAPALFAEVAEMWPCSTIGQLEEILAGRL